MKPFPSQITASTLYLPEIIFFPDLVFFFFLTSSKILRFFKKKERKKLRSQLLVKKNPELLSEVDMLSQRCKEGICVIVRFSKKILYPT